MPAFARAIVFCLAVATSVAGGIAPVQAQAQGQEDTRFPDLIREQFGVGVEPIPGRWFTGDLNGDNRTDLVALVTVRGRASLARDVVVQNPWKPTRPASRLVTGMALIILHGGSRGWDQPAPGAKVLLTDTAFFGTPIWSVGMGSAPVGVSRRGTVAGLPRASRGDSVRIGTEAGIDIHLFWDGRAYRLHWPAEEP